MADNSADSPPYSAFFGVMGASAAIIFSCKSQSYVLTHYCVCVFAYELKFSSWSE